MGDGGRNKILHLLGLVMLSRWLRSCKGSFPPSPPIHVSFLSFSPFHPCWRKQGWPLLWRSWVLWLWGRTDTTRVEAPAQGRSAGRQGILSCAGSQEV